MTADIKLQKALLILDRGNLQCGEEYLREAMSLAETENDEVTLITVLCSLGDLLYMQERSQEAIPFLQRVLRFAREDDLCAYEMDRAREILDEGNSRNLLEALDAADIEYRIGSQLPTSAETGQ